VAQKVAATVDSSTGLDSTVGWVSTPPLVLAHGFTQTSASWGPFLDLLGDGRPLVPVDLPGHGDAPVARDLPHAAHELGATGGWGDYLGYSLGGRVALHLALAQPSLVTSLILIGAHPGIEDPIERIERQASDDELAERLEQIGVPAFLDEWLAQPLFATLPAHAAQRESRELNDASALAQTLRALSTGRQTPLWTRLPALRMPVLFLAGEQDNKYVRIARQAAATIGPQARYEVIVGAGHAVHLEQPEATAEVVRAFLDEGRSTAQSETDGQEESRDQLGPAGGPEHGDERGASGSG
jgi:2-succinyl-6-hydroxy-2,4-cyclohexadiene-1-carboxylate synthase